MEKRGHTFCVLQLLRQRGSKYVEKSTDYFMGFLELFEKGPALVHIIDISEQIIFKTLCASEARSPLKQNYSFLTII